MQPHAQSRRSILGNQDGSVIVAAILILVVVTLLGITATNTSTVEVHIAANDQFTKMAFFNADGAVYGTAKLISHTINRSEKVDQGIGGDAPGIDYLSSEADPADDFYRQIFEYDEHVEDPDIDFNAGGIDAQTEVRRDRQAHMEGGGAEFATGAEGVGSSAIAIFYDIESGGFSNRRTTRDLFASYRKMVGIPGGL
jgi:hypothetical protein